MKHRKFKKIISLLLSMVLLIVPLSSTVKALNGQISTESEVMPLGATSGYYDGLWTLRNAETGRYVDLDDGSSNHLEQRIGGSEASQKWMILEVTDGGTYDGYYIIRNLESGLYMTVENNSSASGTKVIVTDENKQSGQYWKIELINGHRVFTPACAESTGCVLSVGTGLNVNGVNIVIKKYSDDTSYKDEWYISDVSIVLNSIIIYDPDTRPMADYLMNKYYNEAILDIWEEFGVYFQLNSTRGDSQLSLAYNDPSYTKTGEWSCPANVSGSDEIFVCDEECGALSSCSTLHHHSAVKLNSYSHSSLYTCRIVAYHICYYNDSGHGIIGGVANLGSKDVLVSTKSGHDLAYLIQHELSHNLGANDHETEDDCVINGDKGYWCSDCRAKIVAWIQANS